MWAKPALLVEILRGANSAPLRMTKLWARDECEILLILFVNRTGETEIDRVP